MLKEERTCSNCELLDCSLTCEDCPAYQPDKEPNCCCIVHQYDAINCPCFVEKKIVRDARLLMENSSYGMYSTRKNNRQWLESLTLKELTEFLAKACSYDATYTCKDCPYYNDKSEEYNDCDRCIEYWLNQEHKGE